MYYLRFLLIALLVALIPACKGNRPMQNPMSRDNWYRYPEKVQTRWASFENPLAQKGEGAKTNQGAKGFPYGIIRPGEQKTLLDIQGSGTVRRIWMTVDFPRPEAFRYLRIDMYWDGAEKPAVSAPLGEFFGHPHGMQMRFENALFADPEARSMNCYIPMPFRKSARIVLTNESPGEGIDHEHRVFYDVNVTLNEEHGPDMLYFHTHWHRNRQTTLGESFELLPTVQGRGRFLGALVSVIETPGNLGWWGEGEAKVYLDGDKEYPTLCGTGTEDWIGTGWGQGVYDGQYQGSLVADNEKGYQGFYRYHVPDPVFFEKDCRATIQQMGGVERDAILRMLHNGMEVQAVSVIGPGPEQHNLLDGTAEPDIKKYGNAFCTYYRRDDVAATAYFYLDRPESNLPPLADVEERIAPRYVRPVPDKAVVLTFDDAVRSHWEMVAPLLKELDFQATFFVTDAWREDQKNFLNWEEIKGISEMGFEIGNHTASHNLCPTAPDCGEALKKELAAVEAKLAEQGVPKPISFAWPGNAFGPEALKALEEAGYRYARRGMQPEVPYGEKQVGPLYEVQNYHPLLIPTTGDAYPGWDLDYFKELVHQAENGKIVTLQFHGVPDGAHDHVSTDPELFRAAMEYLKAEGFHVMALRDVEAFINPDWEYTDPLMKTRYPEK